jgi:hypothetical protein
VQNWIRESQLKPVTLWAVLKNAASVFSPASLQAMGLTGLQNPFARLVRPKVDRQALQAPPRIWIMNLMRQRGRKQRGEASWRLCWRWVAGCGGAKIGRSSPRPLHDQELPLEEEVLRKHGSGPTTSQESGQTGQQTQDQPEQALHVNHLRQEHHQGKQRPIRLSWHPNCQFAMYRRC